MPSWFKSVFGSGGPEELPAELAKLLAQAKRDRKALRDLLKRAETASNRVEDLADPLEAMQATAESLNSRMEQVQTQVDSFEVVAATIDSVAAHATGLAEQQAAREASSEEADRTIGELTTKVNGLRTAVEGAMAGKEEVARLLEPEGSLAKVRTQVEEVREKALDYGQAVERTREDLADARSTQEALSSRYEALQSKMESLEEGVDKANTSVARIDSVVLDFEKADELGARTERQLNALQTMADHIN